MISRIAIYLFTIGLLISIAVYKYDNINFESQSFEKSKIYLEAQRKAIEISFNNCQTLRDHLQQSLEKWKQNYEDCEGVSQSKEVFQSFELRQAHFGFLFLCLNPILG